VFHHPVQAGTALEFDEGCWAMSSFWPMLRAAAAAIVDEMRRAGEALAEVLPTPPRAPVAIPVAVRLRRNQRGGPH
jgi:hypothetical protein